MADVVSFILAVIVVIAAVAVLIFLIVVLLPEMRPVWVIQVKRKFGKHKPNQNQD